MNETPKPPKKTKLQLALEDASAARSLANEFQDRARKLEIAAADSLIEIRDALRLIRGQGNIVVLAPEGVLILPLTELKRSPEETVALISTPISSYGYNDETKKRGLINAISVIARLSQ